MSFESLAILMQSWPSEKLQRPCDGGWQDSNDDDDDYVYTMCDCLISIWKNLHKEKKVDAVCEIPPLKNTTS